MAKKKNWKGLGLQLYSKKSYCIILFSLFISNLLGQSCDSSFAKNKDLVTNFNLILPLFNRYYKTSNLKLLDKRLIESSKLKAAFSKNFYSILSNKIGNELIDSIIHFECYDTTIWDQSSIKFQIIHEQSLTNNTIVLSTKKGKKIKFPIISTTVPYFFSNLKYCIIGVNYYSSLSNGYYGYYFFSKKNNTWKFVKPLFEMLK